MGRWLDPPGAGRQGRRQLAKPTLLSAGAFTQGGGGDKTSWGQADLTQGVRGILGERDKLPRPLRLPPTPTLTPRVQERPRSSTAASSKAPSHSLGLQATHLQQGRQPPMYYKNRNYWKQPRAQRCGSLD